jgi:hypothetical protein
VTLYRFTPPANEPLKSPPIGRRTCKLIVRLPISPFRTSLLRSLRIPFALATIRALALNSFSQISYAPSWASTKTYSNQAIYTCSD